MYPNMCDLGASHFDIAGKKFAFDFHARSGQMRAYRLGIHVLFDLHAKYEMQFSILLEKIFWNSIASHYGSLLSDSCACFDLDL